MPSNPNLIATQLFAPIAPSYERGARLLGLGQDGRWRRKMVEGLGLAPGAHVLDVAAGTGSITRLLQARGHRVVSADLSRAMLAQMPGGARVQARAEELPFSDGTFDALTFGYLLRYVADPIACLVELARVVRSGAVIGMVEFGVPRNSFYPFWWFYAHTLPMAGRFLGPGWQEVGEFLPRSIEDFHRSHPDLVHLWEQAGLVDVRLVRLTAAAGIVMWGRKP